MAIKSFKEILDHAKQDETYWVEAVKHDFAIGLHRQAARKNMTYAAIAEALGVRPSYVTRVMRGDENLTIQTMVRFTRALGGQLHLEVADQADGMHWFRVVHGRRHETRSSWPKPRNVRNVYHEEGYVYGTAG